MVDSSVTREAAFKAALKSIDKASDLIRGICRENGLTLQPTDLASATAGRRVTKGERPHVLRLDVEGFNPFEWGSHPGLYLFCFSFPKEEHCWTHSVSYLGDNDWRISFLSVARNATPAPNLLPPIPNGKLSATEEQARETVRNIVNFFKSA
ncbi:MAG: hypothetical protein WC551_06850 [Patescibacteria group bacterium]